LVSLQLHHNDIGELKSFAESVRLANKKSKKFFATKGKRGWMFILGFFL